jgi:hypothetical protein
MQASGKARWTATIHLLEILPYGLLLWFCVHRFGILGAASAWTIRALLDAAVMAWYAQRLAPLPAAILRLNLCGVIAVACCAWLGMAVPDANRAPLIAALIATAVVPIVLWNQRSVAERTVFERVGNRT